MIPIVHYAILKKIGNLKVKFVFVHKNSMIMEETVKLVYQVALFATLKTVVNVMSLKIGNLMAMNVLVI
jgi:hypothetical protein